MSIPVKTCDAGERRWWVSRRRLINTSWWWPNFNWKYFCRIHFRNLNPAAKLCKTWLAGSPHSRLASIEIFNAGTWWGSKSIDYDPGICDSGMSCESWEWMVKIFLIYRSLVCALLILLAQWSRWRGGWAHGASTSYLTQVVRYAGIMTPGWKVTAFMSPASNNIQILGSEARDFTKRH